MGVCELGLKVLVHRANDPRIDSTRIKVSRELTNGLSCSLVRDPLEP